jgi:hypothetical protein
MDGSDHRSRLTPIVQLGTEEAYLVLVERLGVADLPPLDAIENEDWGRDLLLSRFETIEADRLSALGLVFERF